MRKGTVQSTSELQCGSSLFSEGDFWLVAHRLTNLKASRDQLAHQTLEPILCCTVHTPVSISSVDWSSMDLFGERLQRTFLLWIWSSKSQNSVFYEVSRWDMDFAWPAREAFEIQTLIQYLWAYQEQSIHCPPRRQIGRLDYHLYIVYYWVSRRDTDIAWPARGVFRDMDSDAISVG